LANRLVCFCPQECPGNAQDATNYPRGGNAKEPHTVDDGERSDQQENFFDVLGEFLKAFQVKQKAPDRLLRVYRALISENAANAGRQLNCYVLILAHLF
jgi:hypothetical protein